MRITSVEIKNFRILEDAPITLDENVTLVVGRNNSGKTSLTEIFYKFLGDERSSFSFEDFSISTYTRFQAALKAYRGYVTAKQQDDDQVADECAREYEEQFPKIELRLRIEYNLEDDLSALSAFIMDLDEERTDATIVFQYAATSPETVFQHFEKYEQKYERGLTAFLRKFHKTYFKVRIFSVDALNPDNIKEVEKSSVEAVFLPRFIYAQNQLDDQSTDKAKGLSKGFEDYYRFNNDDNAHVEDIDDALAQVSEDLDQKYDGLFASIFADLKEFGAGLDLQKLKIRSILEAEKILKGNTQLFYSHGEDEHFLPEAHNGLGYSKLIFTILRFISFYEEYEARKPRPQFHIIFVEEPEAHLHPQMQYVFIKNIAAFINKKTGWKVQVVITTHSSHIVAESGFECIRYFDNISCPLKVKNLSDFRDIQGKESITLRFLQQYMSQNRCDLFFADKAILIEGTVERLLLPDMIKKTAPGLLQECISVIEVGGAYAHLFKSLLKFLNIQTLIITDIDAIDPVNRGKCRVSTVGAKTSNATLLDWRPENKTVADWLAATDEDRTDEKIRLAHQLPEVASDPCGRSFEEAFLLRNATLISQKAGEFTTKDFVGRSDVYIKTWAYDLANRITKKTDFAFDVLLIADWSTPRYIEEGLIWLKG